MEISEIRALADIMRETGLTSLEHSENGITIKMERGEKTHPCSNASSAGNDSGDASPDRRHTVFSPMVGVFYSAPGEDQKPFVSVGDNVTAGDVLCIIEAMKMMNEIAAEKSGVISEICVSNKQVVEFGHPLFKITE